MKTIEKIKKTARHAKKFDAVKMMRDIRLKIGQETQNMTYKELQTYINTKLTEVNAKKIGIDGNSDEQPA